MKLTLEQIREYQEVHFQEFGVMLTDNQAEEQAQRWLSFLSVIFNSHGNEYEQSSNRTL